MDLWLVQSSFTSLLEVLCHYEFESDDLFAEFVVCKYLNIYVQSINNYDIISDLYVIFKLGIFIRLTSIQVTAHTLMNRPDCETLG